MTTADVIRECTREHLLSRRGLLFGQCVTAVGWIGGTVPELTEEDGIIELSMADVAGAGIAVGAALVAGMRPMFVIRYQGFMWYNAAPILNYAAKSLAMWNVPCPLAVRSIAMEGGIGPVASGCHHFMPLHMPGIRVVAPMTPGEWRTAWEVYLRGNEPVYFSEHRRSFGLTAEMPNVTRPDAQVTLVAISASRLSAVDAAKSLERDGVTCNVFHLVDLKPLQFPAGLIDAVRASRITIVIDSDFCYCGASESIAYRLMAATGSAVEAIGLADTTAGFAPHLDNPTPGPDRIEAAVRDALRRCKQR
jgi:pyruvate/2-oxoglutarate/acetoin dehydrogenase E1 component